MFYRASLNFVLKNFFAAFEVSNLAFLLIYNRVGVSQICSQDFCHIWFDAIRLRYLPDFQEHIYHLRTIVNSSKALYYFPGILKNKVLSRALGPLNSIPPLSVPPPQSSKNANVTFLRQFFNFLSMSYAFHL